jgi:hypothetical protein
MKFKLSLFLFFISTYLLSQDKFSKEFSFVSDNDLYVSTFKDSYYTNGLFLSFKYLSNSKNEKLEKKVLEWKIGHEMFTPYKSIVQDITQHDRPFAGYLFGSFSINRIFKNNKTFKTEFQLGVIGPSAFSKELQNFIHNIYGFNKAVGWEHQIKNALGFNFNTEYNTLLTKNNATNFDVTWVNSAKIGTVYTNFSSGFYARIGFKPLQKIINSIAFGTNLNNEKTSYKREIESFLYLKPTLRYALYDATLQGSFLNKNSEVTKELIPLIFNLEVGLKFTANQFNFGYTFNYNTNKTKDLRFNNGHKYGTITINYLMN